MWLVVGLGNPGKKYKHTRHNIGFMVVEKLAEVYRISFKKKSDNKIGFGKIYENDVILAEPLTYMNLCGRAVERLINFYHIDLDNLLIIHDDVDLELGRLKLKKRGGDGGHRGIKSILNYLETGNFLRLRIGIGKPSKPNDLKDYVLKDFSIEETGVVEDVIEMSKSTVETILTLGYQTAMNRFNN